MKKITCLDCEQQFAGETPEEVMELMMMHYMANHHDLLDVEAEEPREGWFMEFNQRWDAALET
jgi:hypothetical protein